MRSRSYLVATVNDDHDCRQLRVVLQTLFHRVLVLRGLVRLFQHSAHRLSAGAGCGLCYRRL
jgi:hypothetical protein